MLKAIRFFLNVLSLFLIAVTFGYAQTNEQITLTTYYPSPQGSYVELKAKRLALGDTYISSTHCWPPAACANVINAEADLVVEGNVGIGTIDPGLAKVNILGRLQVDMGAVQGRQGFGVGSGGYDMEDFWYDGGSDSTYFFRHIAAPGPNSRLVFVTGVPGAVPTPIMGVYNNGNVIISPNALTTLPTERLVVEGDLKLSGTQEGANHGIYMPNGDITVDGGTDGVFGFQHSGNGASTINFGTPYWPPNTWTMTINTTTGNVGIGTQTPGYTLTVAGTAWCASGAWEVVSDARLKKDIRPLENSLETILKLQGVSFKWIKPEKGQTDGLQRGFIAQDVEKVIPEWVKTDSNGYKSLEKVGVEALLVEAIKEQQRKIERLETEMIELKSRLSSRE